MAQRGLPFALKYIINTSYKITVYISLFLDYPIKESCPMSNEGERHKQGVSARIQVSKTACKVREREIALLPNPSQGDIFGSPPLPQYKQNEEILYHLAEKEVQGSGRSALGNPGCQGRRVPAARQGKDGTGNHCCRAWAIQSSELLCSRIPDWRVMWHSTRSCHLLSHLVHLFTSTEERGICFTQHLSAGAQSAHQAVRFLADLEALWARCTTAEHFSRRSSLLFSNRPSLRGIPWDPSGKVSRPLREKGNMGVTTALMIQRTA